MRKGEFYHAEMGIVKCAEEGVERIPPAAYTREPWGIGSLCWDLFGEERAGVDARPYVVSYQE